MARELKPAVCGMCTNKCRVNVIIEDGKILGQEYMKRESKSRSARRWNSIVDSCPRARGVAELIDHPERLNYPLKRAGERGENKWQRVTWDEALNSDFEYVKNIDQMTFDTPAPIRPDADGIYPAPEPGRTKEI